MPDETQAAPEQDTTSQASAGTENTDNENRVPQSRVNAIIAEKRQIEDQLKALQQAEETRQRKLDEEQGNFKKIIADLEPKAQRADALEAELTTYFTNKLNDLKEQVSEENRDLIPDGTPKQQVEWLEKALAKGMFGAANTARTAPNTNAGATGDRVNAVKLTQEERDMARRFGMTDEEYAKYKPSKT